ncbi:MAG: hypothetical protein AAGI01_14190 [Myxococcota bacterium]
MTDAQEYIEMWDLAAWRAATGERRSELAQAVMRRARDMIFEGFEQHAGHPVAVYVHRTSGLPFSFVPGGLMNMGLSQAERETLGDSYDPELDTATPPKQVCVGPMLVLQEPLVDLHWGTQSGARALHTWLFGGHPPAHFAALDSIPATLESLGWQLPWEAQWEFAARGGEAGALTFAGNAIPGAEHLARILSPDDSDPPRNAYGLGGFGAFPEVCRDAWRSHHGIERVDAGGELGVLRGGAALLPEEDLCRDWILMLTAHRFHDPAFAPAAAIRPVVDLSEGFDGDAFGHQA